MAGFDPKERIPSKDINRGVAKRLIDDFHQTGFMWDVPLKHEPGEARFFIPGLGQVTDSEFIVLMGGLKVADYARKKAIYDRAAEFYTLVRSVVGTVNYAHLRRVGTFTGESS